MDIPTYRGALGAQQADAMHEIGQLALTLPELGSKDERIKAKDRLLLLALSVFTGGDITPPPTLSTEPKGPGAAEETASPDQP